MGLSSWRSGEVGIILAGDLDGLARRRASVQESMSVGSEPPQCWDMDHNKGSEDKEAA